MKSIVTYLTESSIPSDGSELLKLMSNIKYENFTDEDKYIVKTPEQLLKTKSGICYDQVELEREYFNNNKTPNKTYFAYENLPIESTPTHTFLIYQYKDKKYYWFENSWESYKGVHGPFNSFKLAIDFVANQLKKSSKWKQVHIIEYKHTLNNSNINQFGNYILKNGTKI